MRGLFLVVALAVAACGAGSGPASGGSVDPDRSAGSIGGDPDHSGLTDAEIALVEGLRADARIGCAPLTADLPKGATEAVECRLDTDLVERVDIYGFKSVKDAAVAYLRQLKAADIKPRSGNCESGKGGDGAWSPGDDRRDLTDKDGVVFDGRLYIPARYGCFIKGSVAHAIATCGKHLVEVVAKARLLEPLHTWVWDFGSATDIPDPAPPGICAGR